MYGHNSKYEEIESAFEEGIINILHIIRLSKDSEPSVVNHDCFDSRPVVFLDASHHLQKDNDTNCALYAYNMLSAVKKLLENSSNADRIYDFALKANDGNKKERDAAQKDLTKVFREELKSYLPCYYDKERVVQSKEKLKGFHLQQRWKMGCMAAKNPDYLSEIGFLPKKKSAE